MHLILTALDYHCVCILMNNEYAYFRKPLTHSIWQIATIMSSIYLFQRFILMNLSIDDFEDQRGLKLTHLIWQMTPVIVYLF